MMNPVELLASINTHAEEYRSLSDSIWDRPEEAFHEVYASSELSAFLLKQGFQIRKGEGRLETAFAAEYGSGEPVIGFLGEYDALPGLSQKAGLTYRREKEAGGAGHGCGHHLLGVGAAAAAVAVKEYLEQKGVSGTVRFYGCPAEESGGGKEIMAQAGWFSGLDVCFTWHPASENCVISRPYLANIIMSFDFRGRSAHAAAAPEQGRSALDACELMNIGVNYLREHVPPDVRIHYAYADCGGSSPNTVPEKAGLLYYVRAGKAADAKKTAERIKKIARGAALMTETRLLSHVISEMYDYMPNHTLGRLADASFREAGAPGFTAEDMEAAAAFQLSTDGRPALSEEISAYKPSDACLPVSSDVGNVSYLTPTAQIYTCCYAQGTQYHTWQMAAQGKQAAAHKGMLKAAEVLALSAVRILEDPAYLQKAKKEWADAGICHPAEKNTDFLSVGRNS